MKRFGIVELVQNNKSIFGRVSTENATHIGKLSHLIKGWDTMKICSGLNTFLGWPQDLTIANEKVKLKDIKGSNV